MRAVTDTFNQLGSQRMGLISEQRDEIRELKIEVAELGSTCAEVREQRAAESFRFARERDALPPPKLDS
jgi:hypothetical protein